VDSSHDNDGDSESDSESGSSLLDVFLSTFMQQMSLPDLIGIATGQWNGLERVHRPYRELVMDLVTDDPSPTNRNLLARSLTECILDAALEPSAMESVRLKLIAGRDPRHECEPVVMRHIRALIDLVLDTPCTPLQPPPAPIPPLEDDAFAPQLRRWCKAFFGEWLVVLGGCFSDGVTSSQQLATAIVERKAASAGSEFAFMLPMLSSTLKTIFASCIDEHRQRALLSAGSQGGEAAWLDLLDAEQRARWRETIERDTAVLEKQLEERRKVAIAAGASDANECTLYKPLSNAYRAGTRRGGSSSANGSAAASSSHSAASSSSSAAAASPASQSAADARRIPDQLLRSVQRAVNAALAAEPSSSASQPSAEQVARRIPTHLQDQYANQVSEDIRDATNTRFNGDYDPQRYPNIEQHARRR